MPETASSAPLTLEIEDRGTSALVHVRGRLVSANTQMLHEPLVKLLPRHQMILLDLSELTQMDSMGLGTLVRLYVAAQREGCTLELLHLSQKVRDLLILTNLLNVFSVAGEHRIH